MDIIDQIQQSRDKIKDTRATFKCYNPENNLSLGNTDWGWKAKKQFLNSHDLSPSEDNITTWFIRSDGEFFYLYYASEDGVLKKGKFGKIDEHKQKIFFSLNFDPKQLLGDSVVEHGQTFPEALTKAQSTTIRPEPENINGHQCVVVEAQNIPGKDCFYSILTWIDTARDYRPMKLEGYQHLQTENPYTEQNLRRRIDDIVVQEFGSVWFPISGNRQDYGLAHYLPNGKYFLDDMREEEILNITKDCSKEDLENHITDKLIPLGCPFRLEIRDIKINQGIDDEEFQIEYPKDCYVYNGLTKKSYIVGEDQDT